ncbi:MAG: superoxide dismutase family protein [Balneolales bacterium]
MQKYILTLLVLPIILISCTQETNTDNSTAEVSAVHDELIAVIHPTEGNEINGTVTFTREGDGVTVDATVSGLEPDSNHGFHIHEFGDCSADDGTSAGGHYSPENMPHGAPDDMERHMGDLGNLGSDQNGIATVNFTDSVLELQGESGILGRGVIVHAGEDDLETQPTGDAGARLGCAVIGVAQAE